MLHHTTDSESDGDGVPVKLGAGVARVAAGVVDLGLRYLERLVRVVLGHVHPRAKLNLVAVQLPREAQPALLQGIRRSVAVQRHVAANAHRLVRRRQNYRRLLCIASATDTLCLQYTACIFLLRLLVTT